MSGTGGCAHWLRQWMPAGPGVSVMLPCAMPGCPGGCPHAELEILVPRVRQTNAVVNLGVGSFQDLAKKWSGHAPLRFVRELIEERIDCKRGRWRWRAE